MELFHSLDSPKPQPQGQSGEVVRSLLVINRGVMSEKFTSLKDVMGKLHDKSLVPKEVRFGVNL